MVTATETTTNDDTRPSEWPSAEPHFKLDFYFDEDEVEDGKRYERNGVDKENKNVSGVVKSIDGDLVGIGDNDNDYDGSCPPV